MGGLSFYLLFRRSVRRACANHETMEVPYLWNTACIGARCQIQEKIRFRTELFQVAMMSHSSSIVGDEISS